mmetsp:Transcript_12997/g.19597  ORF Transcript_12997/g.19597 Transcript_12997/m.19597 type:complete len:261 (+) Transcript_12997:201-983(+)|eukprot:CAMPEP_0185030210 /NCGR_PEP_ID=MMETSP1103-20130426/17014_1 /TAXON_ID=36769 /ORGANISM="Paraphysomonas bandaiensis, Strain Caron Lab Isolate" /LENGTH=260 /DNA_ID=CAMNT_0027565233 /DNA_START=159 /DNA_END=941 /DNA_ORIENTATION=+
MSVNQQSKRTRNAHTQSAVDFYENKLQSNPTMPKYNQYLAAIVASEGNNDRAMHHYRRAVDCSPGDVMIRNDLALHMAKQGDPSRGAKELKKATILVDEQPTLHMNLGALHARQGHYREAFEHARRSRDLRPEIPMNLRNIAKLQNITGDSRSALETNLRAIELERAGLHCGQVNTQVYRAAAVQSISKGNREQALQLVREARQIGGQHYVSPTTSRTNEVLGKILQRKGDMVEQIEREAREKEEKERELLLKKKSGAKN